MFGEILRRLIEDELTNAAELEEITGRSTSTVYRWINDESQPQFTDMRTIVRGMSHPDVRKAIIDLLTCDLPVTVDWIEADECMKASADPGIEVDHQDIVARSLLGLDCLTQVLSEQHEAIRDKSLSAEAGTRLVGRIDETIRHLTASRLLVYRFATRGDASAASDVSPPSQY